MLECAVSELASVVVERVHRRCERRKDFLAEVLFCSILSHNAALNLEREEYYIIKE
jgi:hypothetical protein